ncbi:MAG: alpha-ribazole phosphatase [Prevotellaceae bacterium]|nr:alpha-ribazole phosphatase [Prevotellaceae bacterium]
MEVILIRHTSVDVPKGTCYGWSDVPLNETFEQEAAETKKNLGNDKFDAVYSSPLTRARKLATFCGYPSPVVDDRLKEMHMGDWEMKRFEDIEDKNLEEWYKDYMHVRTTNGESFPMFYQRVAAFLDELKQKPYKRVAIFAHGGVLMCAGFYGKLFSEKDCFDHHVDYGGIQRMEI